MPCLSKSLITQKLYLDDTLKHLCKLLFFTLFVYVVELAKNIEYFRFGKKKLRVIWGGVKIGHLYEIFHR